MRAMPPPLILSRRFAPLFWCQFFAAFNDNFLKTALVFLILFSSGAADAEALVTLASAHWRWPGWCHRWRPSAARRATQIAS